MTVSKKNRSIHRSYNEPAERNKKFEEESKEVVEEKKEVREKGGDDMSFLKEKNARRWSVLSYEQVNRLHEVMNETVSIQGRGNFPTIEVPLKLLVNTVRRKLAQEDSPEEEERRGGQFGGKIENGVRCCTAVSVKVKDIRLNGGAASYVLDTEELWQTYNDLDLIFAVELPTSRHLEKVKTAVLNSLLDLLPEGVSRKRISACSLKEAYVSKMVKVNNEGDCWSLISLGNSRGYKTVELKFVDSMKRPFEFSVDSFQIILDSLLSFYDKHDDEEGSATLTEISYPTVVGESVYGDFQESFYHLRKKLIATRNPEEIRGGGLLKYCNLLARNYQPAFPENIKMLERYMCSRFFIDFPDINQQKNKLENYLWNHFIGPEEEILKYHYLSLLRNVVSESTVCLMGHERRQTLSLIDHLAYQVYCSLHHRKYYSHHHQPNPYLYAPPPNGYYYPPGPAIPSGPMLPPCGSRGCPSLMVGCCGHPHQPPQPSLVAPFIPPAAISPLSVETSISSAESSPLSSPSVGSE